MNLKCPHCRTTQLRKSHRKPHEVVLGLVGLRPFRCASCSHRFLRFQRPSAYRKSVARV